MSKTIHLHLNILCNTQYHRQLRQKELPRLPSFGQPNHESTEKSKIIIKKEKEKHTHTHSAMDYKLPIEKDGHRKKGTHNRRKEDGL